MIKFKEVTYSEYYAMRELYNELNKYSSVGDNKKFEVISKSYLPGILKGNSVVVEKFTAKTKLIGKERHIHVLYGFAVAHGSAWTKQRIWHIWAHWRRKGLLLPA